MPDFQGLKLSQDPDAARRFPDVRTVQLMRNRNSILVETPGIIGDGGNSGFQTVNVAAQFGPRRLGLIGFDLTGPHWHGRHPRGLNNPDEGHFIKWRKDLNDAAPVLAALGIEVFNLSPISTLTAFPFATIDQVLAC